MKYRLLHITILFIATIFAGADGSMTECQAQAIIENSIANKASDYPDDSKKISSNLNSFISSDSVNKRRGDKPIRVALRHYEPFVIFDQCDINNYNQ